MKTVKLTIDNKEIEVDSSLTVMQAANSVGIKIPNLCYDERLDIFGACRMCVVEIEGSKKLQTSCSTKVRDGMVVHTKTEKVIQARREILRLLLDNHPNDCLTCEKAGDCLLQDYAYEYDVKFRNHTGKTRDRYIDDTNPFYVYDAQKCILCGLCVRVCSRLQVTGAIDFVNRGFDTIIGTPFKDGLINSDCVSCGNCVSVCPTGALMPKSKEKLRTWEVEKVKTTCTFCGVGCQINLLTKDDKVVGVEPVKNAVNEGLLCVKGKFSFNFINHPDRLNAPLLKEDGVFKEISWDRAYEIIKEKVDKYMAENGPDSFAGLSSARCTNEENYLFQKLFRAVLKTNNIDHCARL
jgi:formate dehydrogenase major subunit